MLIDKQSLADKHISYLVNFTARGKTGLIYLVTKFVTADTSATIASVVEEAVDDVEEEDKEAQESKNCIRVKHISEIIIGYQRQP